MPTYGYECLSCDNQFETFQSIKDAALTTCETCGGTLRKRIYPVGIAFKGSGFYVNDYAPKSGGKPDSADAPVETAKPVPGGETKSESKPDAKSETKAEPAKTETKPEPKAAVPAS